MPATPQDDRARLRAVGDEVAPHLRETLKTMPRWVQIAALLLGAVSVPGVVFTGIVPVALRVAGIAMQKEVDEKIAATTLAQQTSDKLAAQRATETKEALEAQGKKLIALGSQVKSIDSKLSRKARVPVTPAVAVPAVVTSPEVKGAGAGVVTP